MFFGICKITGTSRSHLLHRLNYLISFVKSATVNLFREREVRNVNVYMIQIKNIILQNLSLLEKGNLRSWIGPQIKKSAVAFALLAVTWRSVTTRARMLYKSLTLSWRATDSLSMM